MAARADIGGTTIADVHAYAVSQQPKHGSIQWFNLIAHSADASVSADDVRQAWKVVNPLLRRLLRPSSQASSATT